tara:strand:+ start:313 stop:654 length:342 start_codon:yes stop_codon:yes gene_type:complete
MVRIIPQRGVALVAAASALTVMVKAFLPLATNTDHRTLTLGTALIALALTATATVVGVDRAALVVIGAKTHIRVGATLKTRATLHLAGRMVVAVAALGRAPKQGVEAVAAALG